MTKVEKHTEYVMDHTDMALMVYHEQDSDDLAVCANCDYSEFIAMVSYLIWNTHTESGIPLEKIGEDLNQAVKLLTEVYEEDD
jgi:hypothetical protein